MLLFVAYPDEREVGRVQTLAVGKQGRYLRVGFYGLQPRTPGYTQRRLRPLARRADRTARPPFVDMRARKPWHLARLRVLG